MIICKSCPEHNESAVSWKLIVNGPVDDVPHAGVEVLLNLHPGPKFIPLGYKCCVSHIHDPADPPGFAGFTIGAADIHPGPKSKSKQCIQLA